MSVLVCSATLALSRRGVPRFVFRSLSSKAGPTVRVQLKDHHTLNKLQYGPLIPSEKQRKTQPNHETSDCLSMSEDSKLETEPNLKPSESSTSADSKQEKKPRRKTKTSNSLLASADSKLETKPKVKTSDISQFQMIQSMSRNPVAKPRTVYQRQLIPSKRRNPAVKPKPLAAYQLQLIPANLLNLLQCSRRVILSAYRFLAEKASQLPASARFCGRR